MKRCDWSTSEELYIRYHDHEWGVPVFDDRTLPFKARRPLPRNSQVF